MDLVSLNKKAHLFLKLVLLYFGKRKDLDLTLLCSGITFGSCSGFLLAGLGGTNTLLGNKPC